MTFIRHKLTFNLFTGLALLHESDIARNPVYHDSSVDLGVAKF